MTLALRLLRGYVGDVASAHYPTAWNITRFAGNPCIDVADNPSETHEQYVPAPIVLSNGDVWVYVKGSYDIYAWKSTDGGETFALQNGGSPVIARGAGGTWDDEAAVEPVAVYDAANNTIHLYYKGTGSIIGHSWNIGHATASDSAPQTFIKDAGNPISTDTFASGQIGYNVYDYAISDVIKIGSTWHFYGYVLQGTTYGGAVYTLIQATGSDWDDIANLSTIYAAPPTELYGHPTVWRMPGVGTPVYVMMYTGGSLSSTPRSLRAIQSSDGSTWSAIDAVDILAPMASSWEGDWVYASGLLKISTAPFDLPIVDGSGRWRLYYSGQSDLGPPQPTGHHDNTGLAYLTPS